MTSQRRSLVTAIGCSIAAIAFALSLVALVPSLMRALNTTHGKGQGVVYTFDTYECVGTAPQFRNCQWFGTVEADFGTRMIENVVYRDDPPTDVEPGVTIEALWSENEPNSAYDFDTSHAWRAALGSTLLSTAGAFLFVILAIYWWRRAARETVKRYRN